MPSRSAWRPAKLRLRWDQPGLVRDVRRRRDATAAYVRRSAPKFCTEPNLHLQASDFTAYPLPLKPRPAGTRPPAPATGETTMTTTPDIPTANPTGYNPTFLTTPIDVHTLNAEQQSEAVLLPRAGQGRHARPLQPPTRQPATHLYPHRTTDHRPAREPPLGTSPHRLPPGHPPFHRAQGPLTVRVLPPVLPGPGYRPVHPPLRAHGTRRHDPRGHQETRADPDGCGHQALGRAAGTGTKPEQSPIGGPATPTCTTRWMTTRAWPIPKS